MKADKIVAKYSKREKDFIVSYPNKPDGILVLNHLFQDRLEYRFLRENGLNYEVVNFIKELDRRGYDPKTIKFSIEKKTQDE